MYHHHHHDNYYYQTLALLIAAIITITILTPPACIASANNINNNNRGNNDDDGQDRLPDVRSFHLRPSLTHRVATVAMDNVHCSFRFSTLESPSSSSSCDRMPQLNRHQQQQRKSEHSAPSTRKDYGALLRRIASDGSCVQRTYDYWTYRLCAGEDVVQYRGRSEKFLLGKYRGVQSVDEVSYENGEMCPGNVRRSMLVKYVCGERNELLELAEPSTCTYRAVVSHPELCPTGGDAGTDKDNPFERYTDASGGRSAFTQSGAMRDEDTWVMMIEKTAVDGRYVCTVRRALQDVKPHSSVCFDHFALSIASGGSALPLQTVVARHANRRRFDHGELVFLDAMEEVMTNDDTFDGSLEYLRAETSRAQLG